MGKKPKKQCQRTVTFQFDERSLIDLDEAVSQGILSVELRELFRRITVGHEKQCRKADEVERTRS